MIDEHPEVARKLRGILRETIMPQWQAYMDLPKAAIEIPITPNLFVNAQGKIVFVDDPDPLPDDIDRDSKWLLHNRVLWHAGWQEDVPELMLSIALQPGRYVVQLEVLSAREHAGHPASAFKGTVQHKEAYEFAMTPVDHRATGYEYRDIGTFDLHDANFTLTLDNADPTYWGALKAIRLVTPYRDAPALTPEELEERIEQLKALGYLE